MENTFIVLRNNKQEGPYNLVEIMSIGLQAGDIVHQENGIAGWQYAMEIDELKPLVSAPQTSPFLTPTSTEMHTFDEVKASEMAPISEISKKESDFSAPVEVSAPPTTPQHAPGLDEEYHKKEKAFATQITTQEEAVPAAAYVAPLVSADFLEVEKTIPSEEQYDIVSSGRKSSKRLKKGSGAASKSLVAVGVLVLLVAAAFFAAPLFKQPGSQYGRNEITSSERGSENAVAVSNTNVDSEIEWIKELPQDSVAEEIKTPSPIVEKEEKIAAKAEEVLITDAKETKSQPKEKEIQKAIIIKEKDTTAVKKNVPDVTQQVYLRSNFSSNPDGAGIFNLEVTLENKSNKVLKTTAVNVLYRDEAGKVVNKQTIYFSDVAPGATVSRPASQHKQATKITCELGLIISEGSLYYSN